MIGPRMKFERKRLGLSQCELSHKSGISHTTIRHVEKGYNYPNSFTLYCLCQTMGITVEHAFQPLNSDETAKLKALKYVR